MTKTDVDMSKHHCKCCAWKYRYRSEYKGNAEQDNEKADWYLKKAKQLQDGMKWQADAQAEQVKEGKLKCTR